MAKKRKTKKLGVVQKIIKSPIQPEQAEIEIHDAEHLYREIRVENKVEDENGEPAKLKQGAPVEVTIEADEKDTIPASDIAETDGTGKEDNVRIVRKKRANF
jgi:hypothetical protein